MQQAPRRRLGDYRQASRGPEELLVKLGLKADDVARSGTQSRFSEVAAAANRDG